MDLAFKMCSAPFPTDLFPLTIFVYISLHKLRFLEAGPTVSLNQCTSIELLIILLYKYDIPVGCILHRDVIFVLLYRSKYKTLKGGGLKTSEILDKYSSSILVDVVSPVGHSANCGCSHAFRLECVN